MYLVALTGGIAAGKSTVAKRWVENGAIEIDADHLAREVVEPGSVGLQRVSDAFGPDVLTESGELDRKALAEIVFKDAEKLELLNSILHPLIRQRTRELLEQMRNEEIIVVYSVPLLVEASVDHEFDLVVTVEAPEEEQVKRLVTSRGLSDAEARSRIASQAKPIERAARADRILNSNQDVNLLLRDADKLWQEIQSLARSARGN
jgi:dephospho-CoA kinase